MGAAPAGFAQQRPRCDNSSSEVGLHNSVYLGGGRRRHEDTVETLFPVIFLGRAAENNVGPGGRVHDMRTMWSPYNQSCNLGGPAGKKVGPEDRVLDMRDMWSSYDQSCKLGGPARKKAGRTRRKKSWARGFCEENEHLSCFLCCSVVGCQDKYPGINQEHKGNISKCRKAKIRNFS